MERGRTAVHCPREYACKPASDPFVSQSPIDLRLQARAQRDSVKGGVAAVVIACRKAAAAAELIIGAAKDCGGVVGLVEIALQRTEVIVRGTDVQQLPGRLPSPAAGEAYPGGG